MWCIDVMRHAINQRDDLLLRLGVAPGFFGSQMCGPLRPSLTWPELAERYGLPLTPPKP